MAHFLPRIVQKKGDSLSPFLLNFVVEYGISRIQENEYELEFNGTYQHLLYADDINI
jgi:hypothetical protein